MSKQRYLLILFLVTISALLPAQMVFQMQSELLAPIDDTNVGYHLNKRLQLDYRLNDKLKLNLENNLLWLEHIAENSSQKFCNSLRGSAQYVNCATQFNCGYRLTNFNSVEQQALYPLWMPLSTYEKNMQQAAYLNAVQNLGKLSIKASGLVNILALTPYETSFDPDFNLIVTKGNDFTNTNLYSDASLSYIVMQGLEVNAGADFSSFEGNSLYDFSSYHLGLGYTKALENGLNLASNISWQYREGDWVHPSGRNQYLVNVRAHKMLTDYLSAFVAYTSRTCSDDQLSELLLISNYLRCQLKYSFAYDPSANSFVQAGIKYSPENEANAAFSETEIKVFKNLYMGGIISIVPERLLEFGGKLGFQWNNSADIYIKAKHVENNSDTWQNSYVGIGLSLNK